eukprot:jgi/Ulvmu1/6075/UM027_0053.1
MIRSTDVRPWFAHAVTVSLSLSLLIAVGMFTREEVLYDQPFLGHQFYSGCKWAAITCAVIAGPVTGGLAQTSLERVLGTIIGGFTGLAVFWLSTPVATEWEWALYSITAGLFGWTAVWMGHKFSLNYSFKLAVITFLLVFAGAENMEEAKAITIARTAGIVAGVLLTLALAVTVYPVSAHSQHEAHLSSALDGLLALHALCWVPFTFAHPREPAAMANPGSRDGAVPGDCSMADAGLRSTRSMRSAAGREGCWGGVDTGFVKRPEFEGAAYGVDRLQVGENDEVRGAEETVVEVYTALHQADAALPLLEREIFVARIAGHPFYVPRFFAAAVGLGGRRRMPAAAARSAAAATRGAARVQLSLHNLLRDGVDGIVKDVLCERYPAALLPDIVKLARSAIQDCMEALETGLPVCTVSLHHLSTAVSTLIQISGEHRGRVHRQYVLYRDTAHDLRRRLHHHASIANARRRRSASYSAAGCAATATATADGTGTVCAGSSYAASAAAGSARNGGEGGRGAVSRLLSAFSLTRHGHAAHTDAESQGPTAPLLQVRTDRSPGIRRTPTPGSHDGDRRGATSPFSALRRDSTTIISPAAIRLSFAIHRDDDLTEPHRSHPAALSQPANRVASGTSSMSHADTASAPADPRTAAPTSGARHRRRPSLPLQRFASEPGPAQLPPQRGHGDAASRGRGRHRSVAAPGSAGHGSQSQSRSPHSTHSTHSSPLKEASDFRATLSGEHSTPGAPAAQGGRGSSGSHSALFALPPHDTPKHPANKEGHLSNSLSKSESTADAVAADTAQDGATAAAQPARHSTHAAAAAGDSTKLTVAFPSEYTSGTTMAGGSIAAGSMVGGSLRTGGPLAAGLSGDLSRRPSCPSLEPVASGVSEATPEPNGAADGSGSRNRSSTERRLTVAAPNAAAHTPSFPMPAGTGGTAAAAGCAPATVPVVAPHLPGATVFLSSSPAHSAGARAAAPRASADSTAPRPVSLRSSESHGTDGGRLSIGDRRQTLTEPKNLLIFPDTPEGHYAQITFYAFQFQLEELVDALEELQAAFTTLARVMPHHGSARRHAGPP